MGSKASPLEAVGKGLLAGVVGTAAMTAAQTAYYKATGAEGSNTPAEAVKKIVRGLTGKQISDEHDETLTNATHWAYGTSWGAVYGLAESRAGLPIPRGGVGFGLAVWAASLVHMPLLGLAPPVWEYPPSAFPPDIGFHLVYGIATAAAYAAIE